MSISSEKSSKNIVDTGGTDESPQTLRITFTDEGACETSMSQRFIAKRRSDRLLQK